MHKSFRRLLVSTMLIYAVICLTADLPSTSANTSFTITDCFCDVNYTVTIENETAYISCGDFSLNIPADNGIFDGCACSDTLSLISKSYDDNSSIILTAYKYSLNSGSFYSYEITARCSIVSGHLACDRYGDLYISDYYDRKSVIACHDGVVKSTYTCDDFICQLMCLDGDNILVLCDNSVYIISNGDISRLYSPAPSLPVSYSGSGRLTDSNNNTFIYRNKTLSEYTDNISEATYANPESNPHNAYLNTSSGIFVISSNTTVSELKASVGTTKDNVTILRENGSEVASGNIGTGMTVIVNNDQYTVAVRGDLTGEGNINSRDIKLMMKYLTKEETYDELHLTAGDLNLDGTLSTKDLLLLSRLYQ